MFAADNRSRLVVMERMAGIRLWAVLALWSGFMLPLSAQVSFMVSGHCPDTMEKVWVIDVEKRQALAEVPVNDGYFAFIGEKPLHTVLGVGDKSHFVRFFVDSIPVAVDLEMHRVSGSELNRLTDLCSQQLDSVTRRYDGCISALKQEWATADKERRSEIEPEVHRLKKVVNNAHARVLSGYAATMVPAAFLSDFYKTMTLDTLDIFMTEQSPYSRHAMLDGVRTFYAQQVKKRPGRLFADLAMQDTGGQERRLSEWCGKGGYVLLEFWASWCAPCRKEMPVVVESLVKYQRKGFGVIGISLDTDEKAWKTAVSNLGMDWTQLSDLKGWKSDAAAVYGVSAIPSNVLLDGEGTIVAADLRGDELLLRLKEIYGY